MTSRIFLIGALVLLGSAVALAAGAQKPILDAYATQAKAEASNFSGFSADRGKAFFLSKHDCQQKPMDK